MIRILLIDDLAVVRESLAIALAAGTGMELWGCPSIDEGIELLKETPNRFDLVLVKQSADGEKADELLSFTNRNALDGRVLIITPGLSDLEQGRLACLGAAGIFAQQKSLADLIGTIREVVGRQTSSDRQPSSEDTPNRALSRQERTAAELVLDGLANKEIAGRMGVSESCIKGLLQRTFLKLGVRTRGQLVRVLMEKSPGAEPHSDGLTQLAGSMDRPGVREIAQPDLGIVNFSL